MKVLTFKNHKMTLKMNKRMTYKVIKKKKNNLKVLKKLILKAKYKNKFNKLNHRQRNKMKALTPLKIQN